MMMPGLKPFVRDARAHATSMPLRKFVQPMPVSDARALGYPAAIPDIPLACRAQNPYTGADYRQMTTGLTDHDEYYVCHCHILEHEEHDMMRPPVASD